MKKLFITFLFFTAPICWAEYPIPDVKIEYSYALDMNCPQRVTPEVLTPEQLKLIPKIPAYRDELLTKLPWFQSQWNIQGRPLLVAATQVISKPFPTHELQAAIFLCPRFPFMGTPLAFNVISYLERSARDIPTIRTPLPIFFFVSTAFHEILHKYINDILERKPSAILAKTNGTELYKAHLHLFALQKLVFESLGLANLLPQIGQLEAIHGPDYVRAWATVHNDSALFNSLVAELKN